MDFQGKMMFVNNSNKLHLYSLIDAFSVTTIMSQRNDSGLGHSNSCVPEQDPESFSRFLEIQVSTPNFLKTRTLPGLQEQSLCVKWVTLYHGVLFSYRKKIAH